MTTGLEHMIGRLLGIGVTTSTVLLAAGLVLTFLARPEQAAWLLHAGLIVLMVTPATRVVLACGEFTRSRDWLFALASLGVLGVLGMTVWIAVTGG